MSEGTDDGMNDIEKARERRHEKEHGEQVRQTAEEAGLISNIELLVMLDRNQRENFPNTTWLESELFGYLLGRLSNYVFEDDLRALAKMAVAGGTIDIALRVSADMPPDWIHFVREAPRVLRHLARSMQERGVSAESLERNCTLVIDMLKIKSCDCGKQEPDAPADRSPTPA